MELTAFENGEIVFSSGQAEVRYTRVVANQLILCARMNDWDRFIPMWKKKTDAQPWAKLEAAFAQFDSSKKWKLKEAFARLATTEEEIASTAVVKKVSLS